MSAVKKKNLNVIKVGDRISEHTFSKQTSPRKMKEFYNSDAYKEQQIIGDQTHRRAKINKTFWEDHSICPTTEELASREAVLLRSKFKVLIVATPDTHFKTVHALVETLKFKNAELVVNMDEARKKLASNDYNVVLAEAEIAGDSTLKLAEYTSNLIVMSGFNESQKRNIVNAGIKAFPVNVKNAPAMALKVVLTMYNKFIG